MMGRRRCNFGYAFINFTTPERGSPALLRPVEGCGWNVHGSKMVIHIVQAKIQVRVRRHDEPHDHKDA
jgi:hypothetical protein